MIYTVGIRLKYERALAAGINTKLGRGIGPDGKPYAGGLVFQTIEDARRFLVAKGLTGTHMILGVNADWDRDAEAVAGALFRRLISDAELVKLD